MTAYQTAPAAPAGDPTAVLGRRYAAAIIDIVIVLIVLFGAARTQEWKQEDLPPGLSGTEACDIIQASAGVSTCVTLGDTVYYLEDGNAAIIWLVPGLAGFLNHVVLQGLVGGSVGKLLVGIRVVKKDTGTNAGVVKNLVRWLLNIVDWIPFCIPLVGIITSAATKGHRRVGDMAAGTLVVGKAAVGRAPVVPGLTAPAGYAPTGYPAGGYGAPAPGQWGAPPAPGGWGAPAPASPPAPAPGQWPAPTPASPPAPAAPPAAWQAPSPPAAPAWGAPADTPPPAPDAWSSPAPAPTPAPTSEPADAGWSTPADATAAMPVVDPHAPTSATEAVSGGGDQPGVSAPTWDADRNAYIQWDAALAQWMQWDDATQQWRPIS